MNKTVATSLLFETEWVSIISIVFRSRQLLDERIYFHINRQLPVNTVLDALNDLKIAQFTMKEGKIIVEPPQDKKR